MTLLLIAFIIVGSLLIIASIKWFTSIKKKKDIKSNYETLMNLIESRVWYWVHRDIYWKLTPCFIDLVHDVHSLTWWDFAIQRQSMAQRIRKHGYDKAINLKPIYINKIRKWRKQK